MKRSIGDKQAEPSLKSLCEDHCQCAQQNSSFPLRRRQQKAQQDSLALTSRSLVLTELQSSVQCKNGVSKVMDGCGCCLVCARQQGDSCDKIHPCDALKQLFCDTIVSSQNGLIIESGICKREISYFSYVLKLNPFSIEYVVVLNHLLFLESMNETFINKILINAKIVMSQKF